MPKWTTDDDIARDAAEQVIDKVVYFGGDVDDPGFIGELRVDVHTIVSEAIKRARSDSFANDTLYLSEVKFEAAKIVTKAIHDARSAEVVR